MGGAIFFDDLESARDSVNNALAVVDDGDPQRGDLYRILAKLDTLLAELQETEATA